MNRCRVLSRYATLALLIVTGCTSHGAMMPRRKPARLPMPKSVSPALVPAPPMARTPLLPSTAMRTPRTVLAAVAPPSWTQLPGSASQIAASPDGTLWALSTQPAGADKYIWHYADSTWSNIPGLADRLAAAPNGTLYAVNSAGGTYAYSSGSWSALGGGADDVTVAADGSVYVLSNSGSGDHAIWRYRNGMWTQIPGAGVDISASWNTTTYANPGGTLEAGGLYVLNAAGAIYYENPDSSFVQLPGAASGIAATRQGGLYVTAYPRNSAGNTIYYYDLANPGWSAQPGAALSLSANSSTLYVVGTSGALYETAIVNSFVNVPLNVTMQTIGPFDGGFGSGKMQAIAVDPSHPSTMYVAGGFGTLDAVPNDTGVYGTTDGGTTWTALDNGLTDTVVNALWLDPAKPSVLVAGTENGGIFRSSDSGNTWTNVSAAQSVTQIVHSGSALYATSLNAIFVSSDDGVTWTPSLSTPNTSPLSLAAAPNGTIYAGLLDGSVMTFNGTSWNKAGTLPNLVTALSVDAANSQLVYANDALNLERSTDGGATWSGLGNLPGSEGVQIDVADPTTPGEVYGAKGDMPVYVSTDSGNTWSSTMITGDQRGLLILPGSPERFVDASDQGIKTCASTASCTIVSSALSTNIVNSITASGSTVAAALQDFAPAVTRDGGSTWSGFFSGGEDGTILMNPDGSGYCYYESESGFAYSTDGSCSTINPLPLFPTFGPVDNTQLIAVDATNPLRVYALGRDGVYASSDHGATFTKTSWPFADASGTPGASDALTVSPTNGLHIIIVSSLGVDVTFDGGTTWQSATTGGSRFTAAGPVGVAISPADDAIVLLLDAGMLYCSTDGGATFTSLAAPSTLAVRHPFEASPHLQRIFPHNLLLAALEGQSSAVTVPTAIAFDQIGAPPYAGLATTNGLYVSTDYGNDWQLVSTGSISHIFQAVTWDRGVLYGGSWGQGILKSTAPLQ